MAKASCCSVDELKVKEGVVYDKHECKVIRFIDFGSAMLSFENLIGDDPCSDGNACFHGAGYFYPHKFCICTICYPRNNIG